MAEQKLPFDNLRQALPWVVLVSSAFFLTYMARAMFGPMLPKFEQEFGINHAQSAAFSFYMSVGYAISVMVSAYTCSKLKPRQIVVLALFGTALVLFAMSQVESLNMLRALLVGVGFTTGHYFTAGLTTLRDLVQPRNWSQAISIHELGPNLSFILGPLMAGLGAASFGWRSITTLMGCLLMCLGVVFHCLSKGGNTPTNRISFAGFNTAITHPLLWVFTLLFALGVAGEFAVYSILSLYLEGELHYSTEAAATMISVSRILPPAAILCGGWITTRFGSIRTIRWCLVAFIIGLILMGMSNPYLLYAGLFIQPLATAISFPPIFTLLAESFPEQEIPLYIAISIPLASLLGIGAISSMLGFFGDYVSFSVGFFLLAALSFGILIFMQTATKNTINQL